MNSPGGSGPDLERAIAEYLAGVDRGEPPDPEEFIDRFPTCAVELREFLDDMQTVDAELAGDRAGSMGITAGRVIAPPESSSLLAWGEDGGSAQLPKIRRFRLLEEIGAGSQGIVYRAEQLGTGRTVALKAIREGTFASRAEHRRFEAEVELASRLDHPNIVSIYECGREDGHDFFAMEYVDGDLLGEYLAKTEFNPRETIELFLQICDAVAYAHQRGVLHRDLKPANVLVDSSGAARIVDFGLAKPIPLGSSAVVSLGITEPGVLAGTWYYASPEQARRDRSRVDVRSDVYALGVILFEMFTDALPYPVMNEPREVIARHILDTPPRKPSGIRRGLDDDVDTIVLRALDKEPSRRYQSAAAMADDLRRYLAGDAIEAKRDSTLYVLRKTLRRYRWRVAAVLTVLVALVAFAVTTFVLYRQAVVARATDQVRARAVRRNQRFMMDQLDEAYWAKNRLAEIAAIYPNLPEVRALNRIPDDDFESRVASFLDEIPLHVAETVRVGDAAAQAEVRAMLAAHESELADLVDACRTHRFQFGVETASYTKDWVSRTQQPAALAGWKGAEALIARAWVAHLSGEREQAIAGLDAARSIAVNLSDGRGPRHVSRAVLVRINLYATTLAILENIGEAGAAPGDYLPWTLRDPVPPRWDLSKIRHRIRDLQILEQGLVGTGEDDAAYFDLDLLNKHGGNMYGFAGLMHDEGRALARTISMEEVVAVYDFLDYELDQWHSVTFDALGRRLDNLVESLEKRPAWVLVSPWSPIGLGRYRCRGWLRTQRSATMVAALLCEYRNREGSWPVELTGALSPDDPVNEMDPFMGVPFGYRLIDGEPVLYSVNEDGVDNGGLAGRRGEAGTDIVFFAPGRDPVPCPLIPILKRKPPAP